MGTFMRSISTPKVEIDVWVIFGRHGAIISGEIPVAGHPASIAAVGAIDLTKLVEIVLCVSRAVDTFLL